MIDGADETDETVFVRGLPYRVVGHAGWPATPFPFRVRVWQDGRPVVDVASQDRDAAMGRAFRAIVADAADPSRGGVEPRDAAAFAKERTNP